MVQIPKGPSRNGQKYVIWTANGGTLYRLEGAAADLLSSIHIDTYQRCLRAGLTELEAKTKALAEQERLTEAWGTREEWFE